MIERALSLSQALTTAPERTRGPRRRELWALALVAVNLQAGIVATGPVAPLVRADLSLSNSILGVIAAIPPVAMGAAAVPGAMLARRLEPARAVNWSVALLAAGGILRALAPGATLLALATVAMCLGAGLATASFPLLAAGRFSGHVGVATAFFTGGTAGGALLASGLTAPVLLPLWGAWSWRGAFLSWGALAVMAWLVWTAAIRRSIAAPAAAPDSGPDPAAGARPPAWGHILRTPRAWLLALLFASQAMMFFTLVAWIPPIYSEHGFSAAAASGPLLILSIMQIPAAFLFPLAAGRWGRPQPLLLLSTAVTALGLAGLALAPAAAPWLWATALGVGLGGLYSICMLLPVALFAPGEVAAVTGIMLTVGYLLASVGPFMMGALRDWSGSYVVGLLTFLALTVPMGLMIVGLRRRPG
ncbi:MAG TPA: MFS transporter [Bacillota bacterium]